MNSDEKLLEEHCSSARHTIQVTVSWFAFAVTANLVAGGVAGGVLFKALIDPTNSDAAKEKLDYVFWIAVVFAGVFVLACILGILGMRSVKQSLGDHCREIKQLIGRMNTDLIPVPIGLYKTTVTFFQITTWAIIGAWVIGVILLAVWIY